MIRKRNVAPLTLTGFPVLERLWGFFTSFQVTEKRQNGTFLSVKGSVNKEQGTMMVELRFLCSA